MNVHRSHLTKRRLSVTKTLAFTRFLLAMCFAVYALPAAEPIRPNIVIFLADDLSRNDCSIYNPQSGIRTPNMERLARDGMTFTHAFVASPSCAPSRGALLTGLSPARNGAMFNHTVPDPRHKRWPAWFQELGYEVVAIGKVAHYATVRQYGFDHCSHFNYHQDDCVEAAVTWLEKRTSSKPLCLFVGSNWPHVPWPTNTDYAPGAITLPPTQVDTPETRQWRARYAAAVGNADRDLGLIYDAAHKHLGNDTLFWFSSDNGAQFPFGKWNCYDEGVHMPQVVAWPGKVAPGSRTSAMVSWVDFLPTCLESAGAPAPPAGEKSGQLSGRSFLGVLLGKTNDHRDRIFTTHSGDGKMNEYPIRAVRSAGWKYIRNLAPGSEHHTHIDKAQGEDGKGYWSSWETKAATDASAAAIVKRYHKRPAEELYDLTADPHELRNLARNRAAALAPKPAPPPPPPATGPRMVFPERDWAEATPESQGVDGTKLKEAGAWLDTQSQPDGANVLVIVRNGRLVWKGPEAGACRKVFSYTKVFTSTVLGLLVDDGKCQLDDCASQHWPALVSQHAAYGTKISLLDSDHWLVRKICRDPAYGRDWVWRAFCRGHNPILIEHLSPLSFVDQDYPLTNEDPGYIASRRAMGRTRRLAERMNLAAMTPREDLAGSGYCLANPGHE